MSILMAVLIILLFVMLRFGLPLALSVASGFVMCHLVDWLNRRDQEREEKRRAAESQAHAAGRHSFNAPGKRGRR